MKNRIVLETLSDARRFVEIVSQVPGKVVITDANGFRTNGKSVLGALHAMEFEEIWVESEVDIYSKISDFVI